PPPTPGASGTCAAPCARRSCAGPSRAPVSRCRAPASTGSGSDGCAHPRRSRRDGSFDRSGCRFRVGTAVSVREGAAQARDRLDAVGSEAPRPHPDDAVARLARAVEAADVAVVLVRRAAVLIAVVLGDDAMRGPHEVEEADPTSVAIVHEVPADRLGEAELAGEQAARALEEGECGRG